MKHIERRYRLMIGVIPLDVEFEDDERLDIVKEYPVEWVVGSCVIETPDYNEAVEVAGLLSEKSF